jgi:hypothetical protein
MQIQPPQAVSRRWRFLPRWRKATWALALFNLLALIWLVSGIFGGSIGAGIGVTWFIGFVVLGLVWLVSRPSHRECPRCGSDVKKGLTVCRSCGFELARATAQNPWPPTLLP